MANTNPIVNWSGLYCYIFNKYEQPVVYNMEAGNGEWSRVSFIPNFVMKGYNTFWIAFLYEILVQLHFYHFELRNPMNMQPMVSVTLVHHPLHLHQFQLNSFPLHADGFQDMFLQYWMKTEDKGSQNDSLFQTCDECAMSISE